MCLSFCPEIHAGTKSCMTPCLSSLQCPFMLMCPLCLHYYRAPGTAPLSADSASNLGSLRLSPLTTRPLHP